VDPGPVREHRRTQRERPVLESVLLAVTEQAKQAAQGSDRVNSAQAVSGVVQHAQEERTVRPTGGKRLRDAERLSLGGPAHDERLVCRAKMPPHSGCGSG